MKYALISDIHANLPALRAVIYAWHRGGGVAYRIRGLPPHRRTNPVSA